MKRVHRYWKPNVEPAKSVPLSELIPGINITQKILYGRGRRSIVDICDDCHKYARFGRGKQFLRIRGIKLLCWSCWMKREIKKGFVHPLNTH